jgi:hypothetical protein
MLNLDDATDGDDGSTAEGDETGAEDKGTDTGSDGGSKLSLADFLKENPDAKAEYDKSVQSAADKREARRLAREGQTRRQKETREELAALEAEEDKLAEAEDFEELGKRSHQNKRNKRFYDRGATEAAYAIENAILNLPEVSGLGEDKIAEITQAVLTEKGDLVTFIGRLLQEQGSHSASAALEKAKEDLGDEAEAKAAEEKAKTREEEAVPAELLAARGIPAKKRTWEQNQDLFNAGLMEWDEFEPFYDEHERKTGTLY